MSQVTCMTIIFGSSGRRTQVILDSMGSVEMGQVFYGSSFLSLVVMMGSESHLAHRDGFELASGDGDPEGGV